MFFILVSGNLLVNKTDLQALYLSGTYYHKTGTRPSSSVIPQKLTIMLNFYFYIIKLCALDLHSQVIHSYCIKAVNKAHLLNFLTTVQLGYFGFLDWHITVVALFFSFSPPLSSQNNAQKDGRMMTNKG